MKRKHTSGGAAQQEIEEGLLVGAMIHHVWLDFVLKTVVRSTHLCGIVKTHARNDAHYT